MSHYAWPPPGLVRSCSDARTIAAILLNGKSRLSASLTRGRSSSHIFPPPLPASAHSPSRPVYCLRCVSPNVPPDGGSHDSQQDRWHELTGRTPIVLRRYHLPRRSPHHAHLHTLRAVSATTSDRAPICSHLATSLITTSCTASHAPRVRAPPTRPLTRARPYA